MPDYSNGKIYQIWSPFRPELLPYIGSTTQTLSRRMGKHRLRAVAPSVVRGYSSKIHFEQPGARIELICEFPCASRMELEREEGRHIRALDCCNKLNAGVTPEQRKARRKAQRGERIICGCGTEIVQGQKYKHKRTAKHEAYEAERRRADKEATRKAKAREAERRRASRRAQKIECECGAIVSRKYITAHRRTDKHARQLEEAAQTART